MLKSTARHSSTRDLHFMHDQSHPKPGGRGWYKFSIQASIKEEPMVAQNQKIIVRQEKGRERNRGE